MKQWLVTMVVQTNNTATTQEIRTDIESRMGKAQMGSEVKHFYAITVDQASDSPDEAFIINTGDRDIDCPACGGFIMPQSEIEEDEKEHENSCTHM